MTHKHKIQLFEDKRVRTVWDDEQEKWYFSIVDVCGVLTDQPDYDLAKNYWKVLKFRLKKEGNESVTKCNQLKLVSPKDTKRYTDEDVRYIVDTIKSPILLRQGGAFIFRTQIAQIWSLREYLSHTEITDNTEMGRPNVLKI